MRSNRLSSILSFLFVLTFIFSFNSCGGGGGGGGGSSSGGGVNGSLAAGDPNSFRGAGVIGTSQYLIGGPLAQGRVGDILLQNDKIRVVIQKPRRNSGVALYGGNIIDADVMRAAGEAGHDNFGMTFPMINISWTPFYNKLDILNADFANGPVIVRATGVLDVYDYIQTSIIVPFGRIAKDVSLFFPDQFNDILNPFLNMTELKKVSTTVVTDYILRSDRSYVIVQTHLFNNGKNAVAMPVGDWLNGSGTLESFIPGIGFSGQGLYTADTTTLPAGPPAMIFPALETDTGVSYGFFYDPTPFTNTDGTIRQMDLLTISGMTVMAYGERVAPGLIPLSSSNPPTINYSLPPGETVLVRYFAVGNGDASSVLGGGYQALGISTSTVAGQVTDAANKAVAGARVLVMDNSIHKPVAMFHSDANGNFSGTVSAGSDNKAKMFGSGNYTFEVYKEGYADLVATWPSDSTSPHASLNGKNKAGTCNTQGGAGQIQCKLGQSGLVQVSAKDENGQTVPARIAVVGFDSSPYHTLPFKNADGTPGKSDDASVLSDIEFQSQQYGYLDALFLDPSGNITNVGHARYVQGNTFRLEPGDYEIFVMRGPEYSRYSQRVTVTNGGTVAVNALIKKVVNTSGYVSADFHIHGINSPDSPFGQKARVQFALAEGLDVMVSADHDVITDYSQAISELGVQNYVSSFPGDEITPMAFGHFIVFPLQYDANEPTGGAFDYTQKSGFSPGPNHHEVLSPAETLTQMEQLHPGEQVLQVNHIMDNLLGNFSLSRLITTTKFQGVEALSTYADPVQFRLAPNQNAQGGFQAPYPFGTTDLFTDKFTAMELCIGESAVVPLPHVVETALPTWFNLLNLGKLATATCSSDTHRQIREPVGILRNFVLSSVDPRDGSGSFKQIDAQEIAHNVNQHHVIVSAGPFMTVQATSPNSSKTANVGDVFTLSGSGTQDVTLNIHVESPDWMDWDTVEVFVNTDPTPAADDLSGPWAGTAEEFVNISSSHPDPKYLYSPDVLFNKNGGGGSLSFVQTIANGARSANLSTTLQLTEDSWVVVFVKGSDTAHTIFPYAPKAVNTVADEVSPSKFLDTLDAELAVEGSPDKIGGSKAFAFTNPIFVDVDGNGFEAKYIKDGKSPLQ